MRIGGASGTTAACVSPGGLAGLTCEHAGGQWAPRGEPCAAQVVQRRVLLLNPLAVEEVVLRLLAGCNWHMLSKNSKSVVKPGRQAGGKGRAVFWLLWQAAGRLDGKDPQGPQSTLTGVCFPFLSSFSTGAGAALPGQAHRPACPPNPAGSSRSRPPTRTTHRCAAARPPGPINPSRSATAHASSMRSSGHSLVPQ